MKYHSDSGDAAICQLHSSLTGLTDSQVKEKRTVFGENKLNEKRKRTTMQRFADQFKDAMIVILLVAAAVSFVIACVEGDPNEFFEPVLILLIVILNAIMGVIQENKAEKALDALKNMSAPHARVIRNGEEQIIEATQLVPGDLIRLEAGDFVPADARLIHSASLQSEESALTGESVPAEKDADTIVDENAPLGDRVNMVFSGSSITCGTGTAVVTAIGMGTEMGKIANLLEAEEEGQTPLQKKLAQLGKYLGALALAACAVIFVVGLANGIPMLEIFMTAVSLAVSAIPEGLPAIVTIVLSIGVQRMVKKNAIIRKLPAVETLGGASVICSDKTGTLTQNRMTLVKAWVSGSEAAEDITDRNHPGICHLLELGTLCCDGCVVFRNNEEQHIGDPTETSIIAAAYRNGFRKEQLHNAYPRVAEIPFDSDRKLMTTVNRMGGQNVVIVKGAFDVMVEKCESSDLVMANIINQEMSEQALRVLAIGYKIIETVPANPKPEELECDLILAGLVGMIDPPRPEAKAAVALCRKAGIQPVMITGDHVVTASAIARELGILRDGDQAITGSQLDAMTDAELDTEVDRISVYARVSPENKIRIVKAWQRKGQVVAMTGDGVNDAPALKAADIGCAMGITGTDVAKEAADMTLTDDNFATIVDAVREGRGIYANIKKVVSFLLGTNIGEVVCVFMSMILWHKVPLMSMQLLWINLVTDSLPAIALGMEPVEADVMDHLPKPKDEGLFSRGLGLRIILQGLMFGVLSLIAFRLGEAATGQLAGGQTMAFMVLAMSQTIHAFHLRSDRSVFKIGLFGNHKLNWAVFASLVLVCLVLFTPLRMAFGLITLPVALYLKGFMLIFVPTAVMEVVKAAAFHVTNNIFERDCNRRSLFAEERYEKDDLYHTCIWAGCRGILSACRTRNDNAGFSGMGAAKPVGCGGCDTGRLCGEKRSGFHSYYGDADRRRAFFLQGDGNSDQYAGAGHCDGCSLLDRQGGRLFAHGEDHAVLSEDTMASLLVAVYIASRKDKGAFKASWIVLVLVLPLFGGILYVLFNFQTSTRKFQKDVQRAEEKSRHLFSLHGDQRTDLTEQMPQYTAPIRYLQDFAGFPVYDQTTAEYLTPGEKMLEALLPELEKAERYIFIETFILEEGVMWDKILEVLKRKVQQGVLVRVIYDDLGCFLTLPQEYPEQLRTYGIECAVFNPFRPFLTVKQNNRDHRKITIIDGKVAFTGGINLADEYINAVEKFGHWKDAAVMLRGKAAWSFTLMFLQMWQLVTHTDEDFASYDSWTEASCSQESDGYIQPYADSPMDDENVGEHVYLQIINHAKDYLYINTPYLIVDDSMLSALCLAAKSGVDVRIVTPHRWDKWVVHMTTRSYYRELLKAGVKIYEYSNGFIHAKTFVCDDTVATVGTTNLDFRSLYLHFECGCVLYQSHAVMQVKEDFLETLKICQPMRSDNCRSNIFVRLFQDVMRLFAPLM